MCGLVGVAGDLDFKVNKVFRNLLLFDQTRGFDSTGVGYVNASSSKMFVVKELGTPDKLWDKSTLFDGKGVFKSLPKVLMGHNRAATIGDINVRNAHPFTFGHITGAHNGTLRDYRDLHGHKELPVDSMSLFKNIEQHGVKQTWENFHGAAAISFWDDRTETLSLLRNSERPLYMCWIKNKRTIVWASERWMIEAALAQQDLKPVKLDDMEDIFMLKAHHIHTFKPSTINISLEEVEELTPKKTLTYPTKFGVTTGGTSKLRSVGFNLGWARGLDKSPRGMVGRTFKLISSRMIQTYQQQNNLYYLVGEFLDGKGEEEAIHIYPSNFEEWDTLSETIFEDKYKDNVYKILSRPRVKPSAIVGSSFKTYCSAWASIGIENGVDPFEVPMKTYLTTDGGRTAVRSEAEKDLKFAGESCGFCDKPLTVDDKYRFLHYGSVVLCEECDKNETVQHFLPNYFGVN